MESRPIDTNRAAEAIRPSGAPHEGRKPSDASSASPAFRVLLERLSASAQELERRSGAVDNPDQLAGAVDQAQSSLADALELGGRLLEAWRAERQARGTGASEAGG